MTTMKSIPTRALTAILGTFLCWLLPSKGWASVQVDGLYFDLNTSAYTAAVASNPSYYSGAVVIPASIVYNGNPYQVTSIGSCAFLDCNGMTSINMPSSVTSIASSAFERCTGLTSLYIGSGVTTINYEAFKNCSNLTTLTLPANVRTISDEVFAGCSSLKVINAERSTAPTISSSTFNGVDKSTCIVFVPEGSASSYANATNWKTFSNIVENVVVATDSCGDNVSYTIYSDMTMVISGTGPMYNRNWNNPINAEYYDQIKRVVIGEGVTSIGSCAFYDCTSLSSITIPSSVTSIGYSAFWDCTSLISITIPSSVTSIGSYAFYGCTSLTSISIPSGVTSIGSYAFYECTSLSSITIPVSVTSFGDYAFSSCTSLSSITIPSSVTSIGDGTFQSCTSLSSITIPSSVTSIGDWAFYNCTNLSSITIPSSVTSIGERAISSCTGLSSIIVDSGNSYYDSRDNCNAIIETSTNTLIAGCKNTVIPSSVTSIGVAAFRECTSLSSITIPSSVTSIGWDAFSDCTSLSSITIPSSVTSIGRFAFSSCTSLSSIIVDSGNSHYDSRNNCNAIIETSTNTLIAGCQNTVIPSSVTSIGNGAFSDCTNLISITIPSSVTWIGSGAFYDCISLTSVWMENVTPINMASDVFYNVDKTACILYVPTGSKTAYENAAIWSAFQNIVEYSLDTDISALDNAIYVEQTEGRIGGTMDISVKLKNSYPVRGFQFKLELPEGTTINDWKLSSSRLPSGATLSDKIATQRIDGNTINVACSLNYGDATFMGNDGEIATVNVTFSDELEVGSYPIYLTACDVTTAGGTDEDLSDVKSTLFLEDYLPGDANGDGKIRIGDATAILNYIVGNVLSNFQEKAADTNGDGKIRIGDATAILNIIVNQ